MPLSTILHFKSCLKQKYWRNKIQDSFSWKSLMVGVYGVESHFQRYFNYIVAVSIKEFEINIWEIKTDNHNIEWKFSKHGNKSVDWNLFIPNLLRTNISVLNRQVFIIHRFYYIFKSIFKTDSTELTTEIMK
jgi:hypothetical protein